MLKQFVLAGSLVVLIAGSLQVMPAPAQETPALWPTGGWGTSTPEEQGMDSALLADMMTDIAAQIANLNSIVITRNGVIVAEVYLSGYDEYAPHRIYSCTKSVISVLTGIAIAQGYLEGGDQPILGFFPDHEFENLDARKESMTIDHFLTMSAGLDWPDSDMAMTMLMASRRDWVQFVLDRPMADEPGATFVYNNGVPHVLSAIIAQQTGMPTVDFAQKALFDPLGIERENYRWETDYQGISGGGWGLWMTPRDMAKLGYLYLHEGEWDGAQIVPAEWVAVSTQSHIDPGEGDMGYGYLWWIQPQLKSYSARGLEGQLIYVVPDQELVVVFTAKQTGEETLTPDQIMEKYIIPAAQSSAPLPANPDGLARLAEAAAALVELNP